MARNRKLATAAFAIAGVLCAAAIANAAGGDGPQWPSIYEPQWPNIPGAPDYRANAPKPIPAPEPELVTGTIQSPVQKRWHDFKAEPPVPVVTGEFGLRYWYSWGKTKSDLYNIPGTALVSRLTYGDLRGHSGEIFGRADHSSGFFLKGYLGAGILNKGNLQDEDFEPYVVPYSSTTSSQREGHLAYASIDFGFNIIRQPGLRIGAFVGYHYLDEKVSAYGCNQTAGNAAICGTFPVPNDVLGISQNNRWQSLRVGLDANIKLMDRLSLRVDAAYLPYVKLNGMDFHWLRIGNAPGDFAGGVPDDGQGRGYQLEAAIAYAVNENVSVAVGGRYWQMKSSGFAHFENHVVGFTAYPQPIDWTVENMGVFVQGSFKFGPYPTGGFF